MPGTEFVASNEFDWTLTPFDHIEGDVLIAFGTNSAWEIAADKNVKELVIADWSANPLIAQAYIWAPFWRIAESPTELALLIGGVTPTPELVQMDVNKAFNVATDAFYSHEFDRAQQLYDFLNYLAREPRISDLELEALTSYFLISQGLYGPNGFMGPFWNLSPNLALQIPVFISFRYNQTKAAIDNPKTANTNSIYQRQSVFHNLEMFKRVKALYVNNSVKYAMTTVNNPAFYQALRAKYPNKNTRFSLSLTNIFECSGYNCLTFFDLQQLLRDTTNIFAANPQNPLVVFRTVNNRPPHGFYRYDLTSEASVPVNDEVDSVAIRTHRFNHRASGH